MENLMDFINKKTVLYNQDLMEKKNLKLFCEEFDRDFNIYALSTYDEKSLSFFATALLLYYRIDINIESLIELLKYLKDFFDDPDFDTLAYFNYINLLDRLYKATNEEEIKLIEKKKNSEAKNLFVYYNEEKDSYFFDINLQKCFEKLFFALPNAEVFKKFVLYKTAFEIAFSLRDGLVTEIDEYRRKKEVFDPKFYSSPKMKKQLDSYIKQELESEISEKIKKVFSVSCSEYVKLCEELKNYFSNLNRECKSSIKELNNKLNSIMSLLSLLNTSRSLTIIRKSDLEKLNLDDDLLEECYKYIIKYNYNIQQKEEEKNYELNSNTFSHFDILFSKYKFDQIIFTEYEQNEILLNKNFDEIEQMLSFICKSNFKKIVYYDNILYEILLNSDLHMIEFIDNLVNNRIIKEEFLLQNTKILYDKKYYNNFHENILLLSENKFNIFSICKNYDYVLVSDSKLLCNQINLINKYNLNITSDLVEYEILNNSEMFDLLDNFIEIGFYEFIKNNPKFIKKDGFNIINRIIISKLIGFNVFNDSNKLKGCISTGDKFFLDNNEYDSYIIDFVSNYYQDECFYVLSESKNNIINEELHLDKLLFDFDSKFGKDELVYEIDGVIISKNRVLRNMTTLLSNSDTKDFSINELLFQAIIYNRANNINYPSIENIKNIIDAFDFSKQKKLLNII